MENKINELLKSINADGYSEGKSWKGYKVLIPNYPKTCYIGEPTVILVKDNECRFSTYDESFEYLKYEQGE